MTTLDITQIAQFQLTIGFQVGDQKNAQGVAQEIKLSVTDDQFAAIQRDPNWKLWSTNKDVTIVQEP